MSWTRRDFLKLAGIFSTSLILSPKDSTVEASEVPSRILWLSWDGADYRTILAMLAAGELPNLANLYVVRLEAAGCSVTKPGHVEAITGLDYWKTGVRTNSAYKEVPVRWTAFWKIKNILPSYWCGCIFSKTFHTGDAPKEPWRPLGDWASSGGLDYYFNARQRGTATESLTIEQTNFYMDEALSSFKSPGLLYCHWAEPDEAGHVAGMDSDLYRQRIRRLDEALGRAYVISPDLVFLYSDHGFNNPGSSAHGYAPHGFLASSVPVFNNPSNGVRRDVAYTLLKILGLPVETFSPTLCGKDIRLV
jgi:hypothetical protein